ncbi:MAG TPA: DUF4190 domain-containing protein [Candidatus Nanoarchaeia archaeon]|nr:DUF4190 domain-containing protein [Candidatus Nanoarchaeia archaeon]
MVLGIIAIVFGWIPFIGWLISIAGLALGIAALVAIHHHPEMEGRGMAIAGIVLSGVAIIVYIFLAITIFAVFFKELAQRTGQLA